VNKCDVRIAEVGNGAKGKADRERRLDREGG
jgi:hypothetical protein